MADWYRCKVEKVGPADDGRVFFYLNDSGGRFVRWFIAPDGIKREMLATALTAISTGKFVDVLLSSTVEYSESHRMYLIE